MVKDVTRAIKKAVVAGTLEEVRSKAAEKFGRTDLPNIHLDSDGTEVDDEDYFQTLEPNAELIAVFTGEQWIDPTHYVTITTRRDSADITDSPDVERIHLKKLVAQMKTNLCNVSVLSEPDLELLSNMDPNSVADITGKDFIEQLKEASGRILHEKRKAADAIELLKLIAKQPIGSPEADGDHDILSCLVSIPATIGSSGDGKHITVHLQPTASSIGEDTLDTVCRTPADSKPEHGGKPI
uniref:CIDE-N domain-containing protein n=1 Tax=Anopheles dirus TaxID=7168 RepID=A0A182MYE3_9DIPT